jgi:hypothetical protein
MMVKIKLKGFDLEEIKPNTVLAIIRMHAMAVDTWHG